MQRTKILHIFNDQKKFSKDFFDFLMKNNFDLSIHSLFHYGRNDDDYSTFKMPYLFSSYFSIGKHLRLLKLMFGSQKIIVHSLASPWLLLYLYLFPSLNQKVYWAIWGKDLYYYRLLKKKYFYHDIYEFFRKKVFKNVGNTIVYIKGDYELAQKWYGVKGRNHDCFMYPSNLYKTYPVKAKKHTGINIQVGNSAETSNEHLETFDKLLKYKESDITIYAPLSYGNQSYAAKVIQKGKEMFGEKFIPLTEFMPFEKYLEYLGSIDIVIFAHKRQQALGNSIILLGLGKKVYMRNDITTWEFFHDISVKVYNIEKFNLNLLDESIKKSNKENIKAYFSEERLVSQLKRLFEDEGQQYD
jgi:hypothetical protein